jgi:hypothetical protein
VTEHRIAKSSGMLQIAGIMMAALFALILGVGTAHAATGGGVSGAKVGSTTKAAAPHTNNLAAVPAAQGDCAYQYLCLWEGYNFTGTIHRLFNCQVYYTNYPIHSVYNHQTPGTVASFRDVNNSEFWRSPPPNWASGNTDGIAGSLNRAWYVKPC